jgi:hypothetical protein
MGRLKAGLLEKQRPLGKYHSTRKQHFAADLRNAAEP